jgi:hypothetical protein
MPRAIARSKLGSSFRTSAGARLMVIRFPYGQRNPLLGMAVDPVLALFDRGIRQSNYRDLVGVPRRGVGFDLHLKGLHPNERSRINLRWHNRTGNCFIIATFARNVFATFSLQAEKKLG